MTHRRDARPWSHDIPDGPWDYIVIGSGIGGMTAAALLAKLGRRVLVLEQHNIPGGFTQTFKRPGYRWDVGVHIVGEMSMRSAAGRLLHELTDGRLAWEPVGEVYDIGDLLMHLDTDAMEATIVQNDIEVAVIPLLQYPSVR